MPWGRSVEQRISDHAARSEARLASVASSASSSGQDAVAERLGELLKLTRIDRYDIPQFTQSYSGNPIGDVTVVELPTWNLNIPSTAEVATVITHLDIFDSNSAFVVLPAAQMGYRIGGNRFNFPRVMTRSDGNPALQTGRVVRSAMATVNAFHPMPVQVAFQHSAITGGTMTVNGSITVVMYGR